MLIKKQPSLRSVLFIHKQLCVLFLQCHSYWYWTIQHCLLQGHKVSPPPSAVKVGKCWTHHQTVHDFFINYRSATEGKKTPLSLAVSFLVCSQNILITKQEYCYEHGIVQMLYEKFAIQRCNGIPLFVFWDKRCLCYGQEWESGFIQGLVKSKVIVLLMSNKVLFVLLLLFSLIIHYRLLKILFQMHLNNKITYFLSICKWIHKIKKMFYQYELTKKDTNVLWFEINERESLLSLFSLLNWMKGVHQTLFCSQKRPNFLILSMFEITMLKIWSTSLECIFPFFFLFPQPQFL